jgi:hypothetical protein
MVVGDEPANLFMHIFFFLKNMSEMHQKQPQNDNLGVLNQPHTSF